MDVIYKWLWVGVIVQSSTSNIGIQNTLVRKMFSLIISVLIRMITSIRR